MKKLLAVLITMLLIFPTTLMINSVHALQTVNTWIEFTHAPQNIGGGGDVIFHNNALYILFGGGSKSFMKLDLNSLTWTTLASTPDEVNDGGSLAFDGSRYFYAVRGTSLLGLQRNSEFWRYDLELNLWESMTNTPEGVASLGSIVFAGGFVYLRPGGSLSDGFYRYDINSQTWETKTSGPTVAIEAGPTCAMSYDGARYIYTFQGGQSLALDFLYDDIWRYDTLNDQWSELGYRENMPRADILYVPGRLYALTKNNIYNFDFFDLSTHIWTTYPDVPDVPCGWGVWNSLDSGASLAYDKGQYIYALNGNNNNRIYRYAFGRSGGPDSFGYTFMDSNIPGGPTYDWIEISGEGLPALPNSDDQWVGGISLNFFFNYYGTDYSDVAIGNNGLLFSGVGTSQYVNQPITQTPGIHGLIAPFWDDLVTWGSAGTIYYETRGTAPNRKFIVEWYDNQHYYSSTSGITFEAILYEGTNNILFQYKDVDFGSVYGSTSQDLPPYNNGGSATVGIEDTTGNIGLQYSFNQQVINPGLAILFKFPAFAGTNMYLSMNAPASMDHGNTMTYTLYYNNFGSVAASNVVLQATLSSNVDFVSASDGGTYDPATRKVTWNIGTVPAFPSGRGSRTVTVTIPSSVPVGTVIQTTTSISTTTLETRYDDNSASAQTTVTGSNLPPNVSIGPTLGNIGGTPSVYWNTPITFTYYNPTAISVNIRIHLDDGGPDITGSMAGGPPTWTYATTFYPRHGHATATYTVNDPTPYFADFDLRNMRGFANTITATQIENYIRGVTPNSPMLTEVGIGQRFIDAGRNNNVNPAFLVATAQHEGVFGTQGWAAAHPDAHNTMGWGIYPGHMDEDWEGFDRNAFASWGDGIAHVAWRIGAPDGPYYGAGWHTVAEIRTVYAGDPAIQTIVNYMNALARSAGQAGVLDVNFNLYVDPAGYIYNVVTLQRISGASVWLQRPDGQGGWENVPTGQTPAIMQPDVNPQITGTDGQYQWDVLEGTYRVHVEASGYYPADSIVVIVPPPVTDLHVGLTPLPDGIPPITTLTIGNPKYIDPSGNVYVTSITPFTLSAEDNPGGTGVALTKYKIYNSTYDSGWTVSTPPIEFHLSNLADGTYFINYTSTDNAGNIEPTNSNKTILDNTAPLLTVETPAESDALQDGVTFKLSAWDLSAVASVTFSIQCPQGNVISPEFQSMPATLGADGKWSLYFDTRQLPDGFYLFVANGTDVLGNWGVTTVPFSIRNWAAIELLPASETNKAGRTMPVKFSIRVKASVDPAQPFIYNEELTIKIYKKASPTNILLQTSTFGTTSTDYRISSTSELYITNFKTLSTPATYVVEIYRKGVLIGTFEFKTVK